MKEGVDVIVAGKVDVGVSDGRAVGVGLGRVAVGVDATPKLAQPTAESAIKRREVKISKELAQVLLIVK